jgi:6-phosphogluconate dehydrogenase
MKIGYIGLGKMGLNMVERLLEKGHEVVANNRSEEAIKRAESAGAEGAYSVAEVAEKSGTPGERTIWLMVPWQAVDDVLAQLVPLLVAGDTVIDGGNSPYKESVRRHIELAEKDIAFLDAGVSGGPDGARNGACIMVGGDDGVYKKYESLFADLSVANGFAYMGRAGAGHFVKMVHNGIEYGMMQAIGEGFDIMKKSDFDLDLEKVADVYQNGSVIESRLVGWLKSAYEKHGADLDGISGEVSHSGEGQWTVEAAAELGVPARVIEDSLNFRKQSQGNPSYTGQVVSALRNEFGGHDVGEK